MSYERILRRVPTEGTDAKLNNGELLRGVFNFEIPNVESVELERFSPRGAGDSGHLQINRHEVGVSDVAPELGQSRFEVGFGDILNGEAGFSRR